MTTRYDPKMLSVTNLTLLIYLPSMNLHCPTHSFPVESTEDVTGFASFQFKIVQGGCGQQQEQTIALCLYR